MRILFEYNAIATIIAYCALFVNTLIFVMHNKYWGMITNLTYKRRPYTYKPRWMNIHSKLTSEIWTALLLGTVPSLPQTVRLKYYTDKRETGLPSSLSTFHGVPFWRTHLHTEYQIYRQRKSSKSYYFQIDLC